MGSIGAGSNHVWRTHGLSSHGHGADQHAPVITRCRAAPGRGRRGRHRKLVGHAVGQASRAGTGTATRTRRIGDFYLGVVGWRLQERADLLHVFPDIALAVGAAQQERRVERRDQLRAAVVVDAAAQAGDRVLGLEQRLGRERAERDDDLRLDGIDLLEQERLAGRRPRPARGCGCPAGGT